MKVLATALVLTTLALLVPGKPGCKCVQTAPDDTTRWGGNEWVAYKEDGVYRKIQGKVEMPLPELEEDVLVEVFDHPDYLICEWEDKNPNNCTTTPPKEQRRVAACKTEKGGEFCFNDIPAGRYELRVSKGSGWSPTHVHVTVDPNNAKPLKEKIMVKLNLGF